MVENQLSFNFISLPPLATKHRTSRQSQGAPGAPGGRGYPGAAGSTGYNDNNRFRGMLIRIDIRSTEMLLSVE